MSVCGGGEQGEGELYWGDVLINCRWGISFSLIESTKNLHIQGIISIFFKKKVYVKDVYTFDT